jgi:hypothetical protein
VAKRKKKDEQPESGPVDPDVAEFLANKSEDAQQLDTYSPRSTSANAPPASGRSTIPATISPSTKPCFAGRTSSTAIPSPR